MSQVTFTVFTKPWPALPIPVLGEMVRGWGFDGVELPVRPGFQVEPERVARDLPLAVNALAALGLKVASVAGPADAQTVAACAACGVPVIRTMVPIGDGGYMATVAQTQAAFDALVPLLDRHGVTIGVQNHCDRFVCNAMGLLHLIGKYDPRHVAAVWDVAHNALNGEDPEMALDIIGPRLCMVNLKNAFWRRTTGPEAEDVQWRPYWTTGPQGLASWPRAAAELKRRRYAGVICLPAEYTDEASVNRLVAQDIAYVKALFAGD
ncbi:MAG: sugar phosphate isomerase/epimerase [Anaerolineae bacterium]|nr:sugar phosphate isomerase/epimerase [Anaerolineae bacterium]